MRFLIPLLIVATVFAAGYIMGAARNARSSTEPKLTRPERRELERLRTLKKAVRSTAMDNLELEPNLNRIYLDEVDKAEQENV